MKTNYLSFLVCLILAVTATSCKEPNPVARLYSRSSVIADQPAKWASVQPALSNAADSSAYLMGYVYGGQISGMVSDGRLAAMSAYDPKDIERGFAIALEADSTTLGTLYGIMLGLEMRSTTDRFSYETGLDLDNRLIYKGFYQGFNRTVPSSLPIPLAEEQLNRLLVSHYADKADRNK